MSKKHTPLEIQYAGHLCDLSEALLALSNCYWNKYAETYATSPHPAMCGAAAVAWEKARTAIDGLTTDQPQATVPIGLNVMHEARRLRNGHLNG